MRWSGLARRAARSWSVLRKVGPRAFAERALNKVRVKLGLLSDHQALYQQRKAAIDTAFDGAAGVDTGGIQHLHDLTIVGGNARFGISHIASDPEEFAEAMAVLGPDLADMTFVDLGSGKGRALLMAAEHPFRRIVGVEFAAELHAVAQANISARAAAGADSARFELIHGDATEFDLPSTPIALFLFNPFDAPLVGAVARRAMASWRADPRPITVIYVNPLHGEEWTKAGWREIARGPAHANYRPG